MIEAISADQKAAAEKALSECKASMTQKAMAEATDAAKKAKDAVNKANQKLARIPEDVITSLNKAIAKLMKIVNGWEDPSSPKSDPDKIIKQLEELLDPVVDKLCGIISDIGLPEIPGLDKIKELLDALKSMKMPSKPDGWKGEWPPKGSRPEIPQELKRALQDLLVAVMSLMQTLPMVFCNILVNSVDLILGTEIPVVGVSFYSLLDGVPYIKQIPDLVKLAPKVVDLVTNAGGKIGVTVQGKLMEMYQAIQALSIPEVPDKIEVPKTLPACPQRDK